MDSNKKHGRTAGFLFLSLILTGIFAEFFVRRNIFVQEDPVATFNNIVNSDWLFKLGIVSDLIMATLFLFFSLALYKVFSPVDRSKARLMIFCVAISVGILCVNMLNQVAVLLVTKGANDCLGSFTTGQLNNLMTLFIKMHSNGYKIAQIFYGLYLFPLGYMIFRSGLLPKFIGVLLMAGCIVDLVDVAVFFLFAHIDSVILENITLPADIAEFSLCIWLMIAGAKEIKDIDSRNQRPSTQNYSM